MNRYIEEKKLIDIRRREMNRYIEEKNEQIYGGEK